MKLIMTVVLVVSLLGLLFLLLRRKGVARTVTGFALHGIAAIVLLYVLNTSGWLGGLTVPTNPFTLTAIGVLGVPGLVSVICIKMVWS